MSAGGFAAAPGVGGSGALKPLLPTSTIELAIKCTGLSDKDLFSKSDPFCVLFQKKSGQWYEIGRTEKIEVIILNFLSGLSLNDVMDIGQGVSTIL